MSRSRLLAVLILLAATAPAPLMAQTGFSLSWHAQAMMDAGYVGMGKNPPGGEYDSGAALRRAQLTLSGENESGWSYSLAGIFTSRGSQTGTRMSGSIEYQHENSFGFRAGIFSAPSGIGGNTNAASEMMLERPSPVTMARTVAAGPTRAAFTGYSQGLRHLVALSFTAGSVGGGGSYDDQQAVVGRAAFLAVSESDFKWLVDGAFSHVFQMADTAGPGSGIARFRDGPEISLDVTRTIDTGNIDADAVTTWNLESGVLWRALYAQGGYFRYHVARRTALPDPSFEGWYLQGSWSLTGETRSYNPTTASFRPPLPLSPLDGGGFGAVELTTRFSHADLNFNTLAGAAAGAVTGGRQNLFQLGVNWFPTTELRLALLYDHMKVAHPEAPARDFSADALVLRAQFAM
jgi:phosphate-selective porin OprO/OprP